MSKSELTMIVAITLAVWLAALFSSGCATTLPHHNPAYSWSQDNLKRNDSGCPTAIYVAPGGVLELCPVQ
jgi:hypothetical protein